MIDVFPVLTVRDTAESIANNLAHEHQAVQVIATLSADDKSAFNNK